MARSFYIAAYWGSRAESLLHIRDKILQTLELLATIDQHFLNWYERGMSRKQALERGVSLSAENIERLCRKAVKKTELDNRGFSKNGFHFGLWTGHPNNETSSISFTVGDTFKITNLSNVCTISIPSEGVARERLLQVEKAKKVLSILVDVWNPDYAVLMSHDLSEKLNTGNKIGWITYHKSIKQVPKLSSKIVYEKSNNGNWFYPVSDNYDNNLADELLPIKEIV